MTLKSKTKGTVAGKKSPVVKGKAKPTVQGKSKPIVRGKAKPVASKNAKPNPRGASGGQVNNAKAFSSGRSLLSKLFTRLGVPAAIAGLGYQAYKAKKETDASTAKYEKQARKIAMDSAAFESSAQAWD